MRVGPIASVFVASLAAIALVAGPTPITADDAPAVDGKAIFEEAKCNMCHTVSSAGIEAKVKAAALRGPDLTELDSERDDEWLAKFLRKQEQLDGKDHKKEFKGSDEELTRLIAWVRAQKK